MRIVLMVAAGIAVAVTVALAVVVQVIEALLQMFERLLPGLAVLALVVMVVHVVRRRGAGRVVHGAQSSALPALPAPAHPAVAPGQPQVASEQREPYLQWGPPMQEHRVAPPAIYSVRHHVPRARGAHPSTPVRGRRP